MYNKCSVIILSYNQSSLLKLSLNKLEKQTNNNFEVIITDDGSRPDEIHKIISIINNTKLDVKFIFQKDNGYRISKARNNAIKIATGDILIFLDGDIVPDELMIQEHIEAHNRNLPNNAVVYSDRGYVDYNNYKKLRYTKDNLKQENMESELRKTMCDWQCCWGFNVSYPKRDEVFFDEGFKGWGMEDTELSYRMTKEKGYKIDKCSKSKSLHVNLENQEIHNPYIVEDKGKLIEFINNILYFINKYKDDEEVLRATVFTIPLKNNEIFFYKDTLELYNYTDLLSKKEELKKIVNNL